MNIEELNNRINEFSNYKKQIEQNKPFHFNIIDSIKSKETDHSRILGTILNKNDNGSYAVLKSYLDFFGIKEEINNPEIKIEKGRIDVSIIDVKGNYAVIIENKIFDAVDQPNQINNYYEHIQSRYKNINIHIQYLTKFGKKEPGEDSLSIDVKEELGGNFNIISYSKDILNWLTSMVLPNCKIKNKELIYSIELYIDYIKGITNNRMNLQMEKELRNKVNEILNISNKPIAEKALKLNEALEKLEDFKSNLEKMNEPVTNEIRGDFFKKLHTKLKENGNWQCVTFVNTTSSIENYNQKNFGFKNLDYVYGDSSFSIEIQDYKRYLAGVMTNESARFNELTEKLKPVIGHLNRKNNGWIVRLFKEFEIETDNGIENFVNDFYNSKYNTLFIENMDVIVEKYYSESMVVFNEWKKICENN
jgi:hypothetical protein